jgi:V/A-type H+-transporting ATPase subunit C
MKAACVDFNFLCGILRSREAALLNRQKLESILSAGAGALLQTVEGLFGERVRSIPGAAGIESGYRAEIASISELFRYSPSDDFIKLVFLPWEFHNLKVAAMRKLDGRGGDVLFGPEGEITTIKLQEAVQSSDISALPKHLGESLQAAMKQYETGEKDLRGFELCLDRRRQMTLERFAEAVSPSIHSHFRTVSDISTADAFFRAYFAKLAWESVSPAFEGHPDATRLKILFHAKAEDWSNGLSGISRRVIKILLACAKTAEEAAAAVAAEKRAHLVSMSAWSYKPPSAEYAFYFLTRKLADIYNLRLVLLGLLGRVAEDDIKRRINDAFI